MKATRIKKPILQTLPVRQRAYRFAGNRQNIFLPYVGQENATLSKKQHKRMKTFRPTTLKEVKKEIKKNIDSKKAPGFYLIIREV